MCLEWDTLKVFASLFLCFTRIFRLGIKICAAPLLFLRSDKRVWRVCAVVSRPLASSRAGIAGFGHIFRSETPVMEV